MPTKKPASKTSAAPKKVPAKKVSAKKVPAKGVPAKKVPGSAKKPAKPSASLAREVPPPFTERSKGLSQRGTRSEAATTPAYRLHSASDLGPEVAEILKFVGMQATRPLTTDELQRLLKAPGDVFAIADNAAAQFDKDKSLLGLRDFPAEQLQGLVERAMYLRVRPQHLQEAATIAQHQQLIATSDLQDALLRIRRRVISLLDEWPELRSRWQFLLDYFERMYPGPGSASSSADNKAEKPPKPEVK